MGYDNNNGCNNYNNCNQCNNNIGGCCLPILGLLAIGAAVSCCCKSKNSVLNFQSPFESVSLTAGTSASGGVYPFTSTATTLNLTTNSSPLCCGSSIVSLGCDGQTFTVNKACTYSITLTIGTLSANGTTGKLSGVVVTASLSSNGTTTPIGNYGLASNITSVSNAVICGQIALSAGQTFTLVLGVAGYDSVGGDMISVTYQCINVALSCQSC